MQYLNIEELFEDFMKYRSNKTNTIEVLQKQFRMTKREAEELVSSWEN